MFLEKEQIDGTKKHLLTCVTDSCYFALWNRKKNIKIVLYVLNLSQVL